MNLLTERRGLIEAALMATLTSIFVIGFLYVPFLSILLIFLPVPFLVLAHRHGKRAMGLSFIITGIIVGALTGFINSAILLIIFAPLSFAMGVYICREAPPYKVIGIGTLLSVISLFAFIQIVDWVAGVAIIDEILWLLQDVIDHQQQALENFELTGISTDELFSYMAMILPGMLIVQSLIVAFLNYYMMGAVLKRLGEYGDELPEFSSFRWPSNIILGSFVIFLLTIVTRWMGIFHGETLVTNITLIFSFVFFLQGIAFISFMIKKRGVRKGLRMMILALIIVISPLLTIVALLGVVDALFDVRKLRRADG